MGFDTPVESFRDINRKALHGFLGCRLAMFHPGLGGGLTSGGCWLCAYGDLFVHGSASSVLQVMRGFPVRRLLSDRFPARSNLRRHSPQMPLVGRSPFPAQERDNWQEPLGHL